MNHEDELGCITVDWVRFQDGSHVGGGHGLPFRAHVGEDGCAKARRGRRAAERHRERTRRCILGVDEVRV